MLKTLSAVVLMSTAVTSPGFSAAQTVAETDASLDMLFGEHASYRAFLEKLKAAVAADDRATVAGMVSYPFATQIGGKAVTFRDAHHLLARYDQIVTAKVKRALAQQDYADLFANDEGVMVGNGEIWFSGIGAEEPANVLITAINH